jgi:hypothetical protein
VALPHKLRVETSKGEGYAIAMANYGPGMAYLVAPDSRDAQAKPEWLEEGQINVAYVEP